MEKIKKLIEDFSKKKLDGYIVPKNDEFFTEYTPKHKDNLKFISNFTGSFGYALILKKNNYLIVDGRYSIQAKVQSGKNYKIVSLPLKKNLDLKNKLIGFNPKLFNQITINNLSKKLNCQFISTNTNIFDTKDVKEKVKKFYFLKDTISGENHSSKIKKIIGFLKRKKIDIMVITAPENVAWLLNIRGEDSKYSPIPNSYLTIDSKKNVNLFCKKKKITSELKYQLRNIDINDINYFYIFLKKISFKKISIDALTCSIYFKKIIEIKNKVINDKDPIYDLKSVKNRTELFHTKKAHEYDGAALTKFLFWVKNNYKHKKITEIFAQNKLLSFKKKFRSFKSLSFPTISGTGSNGAIVHYNANKKTNKTLKRGDIYLVDSGAQYYYGTTDVTRTISLDNQNKKIKEIFTRVLKGHLGVYNFKLKKNTTGNILDKLARKYLNKIKLDYSHGTGHGVGFFLNVHEGPQSISKFNKVKLKPGMILSNEPGYYKSGNFGIRIENLIMIKNNKKIYKFENLTYAPIDKSLIDKKLLENDEIELLNKYHKDVYQKLKKYMNSNEIKLLKIACSKI